MIKINYVGYWSGIAAFTATVTFVVVQMLQIIGVLQFPADEILIYGSSLCIVVPLILEMLALHYLTPREKQFWSHAALIFVVIYAVFVASNYVVQLATVIPAKMNGSLGTLGLLEQTPHSLFWDYDAVGYIAMGLACLLAVPALEKTGIECWARRALIANGLVTPLICVVYFRSAFQTRCCYSAFLGQSPRQHSCSHWRSHCGENERYR